MFQPVIGVLYKVIEQAVPRFLKKTLETRILLLIYYMYKKTSLAAPTTGEIIILKSARTQTSGRLERTVR
jgi:hypothetical protein